jgi:hypothetical protein
MFARRVDANHSEIVATLRKAGATVLDLSRLGSGAPDIAIGYGRLTMLAEIKDGSKKPSARRLTDDEREWHDTWTGCVRLLLNEQDACEAVATLQAWSIRLRSS